MIDQADLDRLKDLRAKAATGQVNVAVLDFKGNQFQMQATKPAVAIAFFRNRANADYAAAAWTWLPKLIAELEDKKDEADLTMKALTFAADPYAVLKPRSRRQPRVRKRAPTE